MLWILFSEFQNRQHRNAKIISSTGMIRSLRDVRTAGGGISCLATGFRDTILSISVVGVDDSALASIYRLSYHCHRHTQPTCSHSIVFQQIS